MHVKGKHTLQQVTVNDLQGWNKKYDEWVEEIGCRTDNPDEEPLLNNKKAKVTKPGDKTPQVRRPTCTDEQHAVTESHLLEGPSARHAQLCCMQHFPLRTQQALCWVHTAM